MALQWVAQQLAQVREFGFYNILLACFITSLGLILSTRLLTGLITKSAPSDSRPHEVPYWFPIIRHAPSLIWSGPDKFFRKAKNTCPQGLFKIKVGTSKVMVYSPNLTRQLKESSVQWDDKPAHFELLHDAFTLSIWNTPTLEAAWPEIAAELQKLGETMIPDLIPQAIKGLEKAVPNLISFNSSPIDQMWWERMSGTVVLDGNKSVVTGLFALTQTFLLFFTTEHLLSPTLLDENPNVAPLLLTLPSQLDKLLFTPRLLAPRPHAVLRSARTQTEPFLDAVNLTAAGSEEHVADVFEELEDADTPFLRVMRLPAVTKLPRDVRFTVLLYLLTLSVVPHMLASWTIADILPRPEPEKPTTATAAAAVDAENARNAVAAAVTVTQEESIGAFQIPPEVHVDAGAAAAAAAPGVADSAAARARGWREGVLAADVRLRRGEKADDAYWLLRGGETVVAAEWFAGEAAEAEKSGGETPEEMLVKAFERLGMFHLDCLSKYYASVYPVFIAALLKLYKIEPVAVNAGWKEPVPSFAPGVALPIQDVRVRISLREFDAEGNEVETTSDVEES